MQIIYIATTHGIEGEKPQKEDRAHLNLKWWQYALLLIVTIALLYVALKLHYPDSETIQRLDFWML